MSPSDRNGNRRYALVAVYSLLAVGWMVFAYGIAPSSVASDHPGRLWTAFLRFLQPPPALFYNRDLPHWWRQFSGAVLIGAFLHFSLAWILRSYDAKSDCTRSLSENRAGRRISLALLLLSFLFLGVTVLFGPYHDYYFYLQIWSEVRAGNDPWFLVTSKDGVGPLNAYGPLFNLLAPLAWINLLLPKLLFAYAYTFFASIAIKECTATQSARPYSCLWLFAIFWNPYPWIQIAMYGHFDIVVALLCVGSVHWWSRHFDKASALMLAAGVLLKFMPIALVPFMAVDRGRVRVRFLVVALAAIAIGMALSYAVWGPPTWAPIRFAASRPSVELSIFAYLRTDYSPWTYLFGAESFDDISPVFMVLALGIAWYWYIRARPSVDVAAVVAITTMVLFHRTGHSQYQMVPFAMAAWWLAGHSRNLLGRPGCAIAIASYLIWVASYEVYYFLAVTGPPILGWNLARQLVGLPAFLTGYALMFGLAAADPPKAAPASLAKTPAT